MARKDEAEQLLREGLDPSGIARQMGISIGSVIQYLRTQVGEGSLRLSDLYFSFPPEKRKLLQAHKRKGAYTDDHYLRSNELTRDELDLFESLRSQRVFSGDMYEYISLAEVSIHNLVRTILEREFGSEESGWWRQGVPSNIRAKCATRREEDEEPCECAYAYTTLIDLSALILKNWQAFSGVLPKEYAANRGQIERDLIRLNRIRNSIMHPVKERKWSEDDFEFVRSICELFQRSHGDGKK
jgi:hypothetical protein